MRTKVRNAFRDGASASRGRQAAEDRQPRHMREAVKERRRTVQTRHYRDEFAGEGTIGRRRRTKVSTPPIRVGESCGLNELALLTAHEGSGAMCGWDGNGWMWNGGWGWIVSAAVFTVLFAVVITGIVLGVRYLASSRHGTAGAAPQSRAAEDVLGERLARGEIDDNEYRQRMATLREHR